MSELLEEMRARFTEFDGLYFQGRLHDLVQLVVVAMPETAPSDVEAAELAYGATSPDGREIRINPEGDHEWEFTLLHEMVHAFEALYPGVVQVSPHGETAHRQCPVEFYEVHSAAFFSKLFEVMVARGHDPKNPNHFGRYFG